MKKMLFYCCFLMLPLLSLSQINTSIDLVGSYDLINKETYKFGSVNYATNSRQGNRFGANFNFRVFDQGYIKTGLRYVKKIHNIALGRIFSSNYQEYIDEYYIEIPIVYRYEFRKRKFSFYTEGGVSPHFFLKGKFVQQINGKITSTDYEIPYLKDTRVRMSIVFGIGANYILSRKMQIFIQPTYRYYPLIGNQASPIAGTYNLGVEFGVRSILSFAEEN